VSAEIKPLETLYAGVRFRSRAEARWAVFFDALKLKWQYEPEGYQLPNGDCYLPDFVLEKFGIVEIKPMCEPEAWPKDCRAFMCGDMLNQNAHIMCGIPGRTEDSVWDEEATYHGFTQGDHNRIWVMCEVCARIDIIYGSESNYRLCERDGCPGQLSEHAHAEHGQRPRRGSHDATAIRQHIAHKRADIGRDVRATT